MAGSSPGAASDPRQVSVVPQAPHTAAPSARVACSASPRGTTAPVATKIRRASGGSPVSATARTRSARNGVAAWTNVPPCPRSARSAARPSHTGSRICAAPSTNDSHMPYRKPVWWASGDGMKMRSALVRPRCRTSIAAARLSASIRCTTPFGSPEVPEVNSSWARPVGAGTRAASAARPGRWRLTAAA